MRVLILTCNTGGGHNAVAAALTEEFRRRGADCTVLDGLSFISQKASKFVSRWHTRLYRHHPHLYKAGYMTAEEETGRAAPKNNPVDRYLARGARHLSRYLQAQRFDAVVCVHVIPALMMTMLRQNGGASVPFCFVATDYTCSPTVGSCTPDICVIPHQELAEEFIRCGIAAETLLPAGIPTRSVFHAPPDRTAARRELELPPEGRHILLMSGSIGCGPMTELARQLDERLRSGDYATVLCGSNRQMLYALQLRSLLRVQAVGFTSRVAQYMDSADLLVSKPGGISITEAACKGVPMLLADLVGGCETRNQAFFSAHGWAASCDTDAIADSALSLLADDDRCRRMVETQRRSFDGQAAQRICRTVDCDDPDVQFFFRRWETENEWQNICLAKLLVYTFLDITTPDWDESLTALRESARQLFSRPFLVFDVNSGGLSVRPWEEPGQPTQPDQPDQPDDGKQDDKPTTGDSFSAGWLALPLFSGAMAACMVLPRRKKAD